MPGETTGPTEAELNQGRDDRIAAELQAMNVGRVQDKDVAEEMAYADRDARIDTERSELTKAIPKPKELFKQTGEYRDTIAVRDARENVADVIASAGQVSGEKQGEAFIKDRAEHQKGYIQNKDEALEMAYAEKPGLDMAANFEAIGSHKLAKGRVEAAKIAGLARSESYYTAADAGAGDIEKVQRGEKTYSYLTGKDLDAIDTVIQGFAGQDAMPVYEQDKGIRGNKVREAVYASTSSPDMAMIVRRNAKTGEVISAYTTKTRARALETHKGVQTPTRELRGEMKVLRDKDEDPENTNTEPVLNSKGPRIQFTEDYGNVGEYAMLQSGNYVLDTANDDERKRTDKALASYRARRKQQRSARPWWAKLLNRGV